MKPFSYSQFTKYFNMWTWSHPDIRQTYWTKTDNVFDYETRTNVAKTFTLSTIWYKDSRVLQFYTNDENNGNRKLTWYNVHRDNAIATGLMTSNNWRANANTIVDSLYYTANPPKYYNNDGSLKKGFWNGLIRRLRSPALRTSIATELMLHEAVTIATQEIENTVPPDDELPITVETIFTIHDIPSYAYYQDFLTKAWYVDGSARRIRLGSMQWTSIHKHTSPEDYDYEYDEDHDIYLLPTQIIVDNNVYDRNSIVLVECIECEREVVESTCVDGVCRHCLDAHFKIHSYSTRVEKMLKFKAKNVRPNTIYFGCELEYETINRDQAQVDVGKLMHGHALMKSDGSIRNGFEIVTCPATLDIHLDIFKKFYENIPKDLKIEKNVGMHVHISRKPLSQLTIGKLTAFLNNLDNKDFIHNIAGRIDNQYARMDKQRTVTFPWKYKNGGDRYNAVNLNNPNTIEIRLFATPMDYKTFAMRLQFCQALVDYCSPAATDLDLKKHINHQSFSAWINQRRRMFPELSYHLKGSN